MLRSLLTVRILQFLACALVIKTTVSIIWVYGDYFPPNFDATFLLGRERYFAGAYEWAFYAHILIGPFNLLAGLFLISEKIRRRYPKLHRVVGRVQIATILVLLLPSGLWMARYAITGAIAGTGFACLSVATAVCVVMGWRAAVGRRFAEHRRWMLRCFALLCSAVVIRVIGGLSEVLAADWTYPWAAWLSWLLPLAAFEVMRLTPPTVRPRRS